MEINIKYFLQIIQNTVLLIILFVMPEENKFVNFYNSSNLTIYKHYRIKQLHNDNEIIIRNLK